MAAEQDEVTSGKQYMEVSSFTQTFYDTNKGHIVIWRLKGEIAEPEEVVIARQRLGKHATRS
jgi:hypothetical protein